MEVESSEHPVCPAVRVAEPYVSKLDLSSEGRRIYNMFTSLVFVDFGRHVNDPEDLSSCCLRFSKIRSKLLCLSGRLSSEHHDKDRSEDVLGVIFDVEGVK